MSTLSTIRLAPALSIPRKRIGIAVSHSLQQSAAQHIRQQALSSRRTFASTTRLLRPQDTPPSSNAAQTQINKMGASDDKLHHIESAAQLDALFASTTYVAVDFFADWCPPCKAIAPIWASLAARWSVPGYFAFAKVNVDHVHDVSARYRVTAMPTFLFFKEGRQVAVNGQPMIQGADPRALMAAAEKLGGLAQKKAEEAASAAPPAAPATDVSA
jgi:thioredoxin 1